METSGKESISHHQEMVLEKQDASDKYNTLQKVHGGLLEEMVRRLSDELARYQIAARGATPNAGTSSSSSSTIVSCSTLPPWLQDASALSPLLIAYDKQLSNKEATLDQQRLDLIKLKEEFSFILNENSMLHEELERSKSCLQEALKDREDVQTMNSAAESSDSTDKSQDNVLLLKENDLLVQQQREYQKIIDKQEHQLEELTSRIVLLESSDQALKQQNEQQRQKEVELTRHVEELEHENNKLQSSLLENARVIEKHKVIVDMKEYESMSKAKVEAAMMSYQTEVDRLINDNSKMSTLLTTKVSKAISLQSQIDSLHASLEQERENVKSKGHESEYFRTKAMQYEQRVHEMQAQESEMILKVDEALHAAGAAELDSERKSLTLQEKCLEIENLRTQMSTSKRDWQNSADEKLARLQQDYTRLCEEKREESKKLESVICELRLEKDQLRHKISMKERIIERLKKEAIVSSIDNEKGSKDVGVNIYEEQMRTIKELQRERDEANEKASSIIMASERDTQKWEGESLIQSRKVDEAEAKMNDANAECSRLTNELEKVIVERNELSRKIRTIISEHRHEINSAKASADSALMEQHERMRKLQFGYETNIASKIDAISEAQLMLKKSEGLSFQFKEEVERMRRKVEIVQKDSESKTADLLQQLKKSDEYVNSLKEKLSELEANYQMTRQSMATGKAILESFKKREQQMKKYIHDVIAERDSLLEAKSSLQSEIDDLDLQRQRLSRQRNNALEQVQVLRLQSLHQINEKDGIGSLDSRTLHVN